MSKGLEIIKQKLNTIRENTKVDNRRIADEENEDCIKCIETCLSDIEKKLKALKIINKYYFFVPTLGFMKRRDSTETREEYDLLKEVLL